MQTDKLLILQLYKLTDGSMPSIDWQECGLTKYRHKHDINLPQVIKDFKQSLIYDRKKLLDTYCVNGCDNWNILHSDYLGEFEKELNSKKKKASDTIKSLIKSLPQIKENQREFLAEVLQQQKIEGTQFEYSLEYLLEKTIPTPDMIKSWGYSIFPPISIREYLSISKDGKKFIDDLLLTTKERLFSDCLDYAGAILHAYQKTGQYKRSQQIISANISKLTKYPKYLECFEVSEDLKDLVFFSLAIPDMTTEAIESKLLLIKKYWAEYLLKTNLVTPGQQQLLTAILPHVPNPRNRHTSWQNDNEQKAKYLAQLNQFI